MKSSESQAEKALYCCSNNIFYFNEAMDRQILGNIRQSLLTSYEGKNSDFLEKVGLALSDIDISGCFSRPMLMIVDDFINNHCHKKYPLLCFRKYMKKTFGLASSEYAILNRAITLATGPFTFCEGVESYLSINMNPSQLTLKFLNFMKIKMKYKDDSDVSWITPLNQMDTYRKLNSAASKIQTAYINFKSKRPKGHIPLKVLIYDIKVSQTRACVSPVQFLSNFQDISSHKTESLRFIPTFAGQCQK